MSLKPDSRKSKAEEHINRVEIKSKVCVCICLFNAFNLTFSVGICHLSLNIKCG